MSSYLPSLPAPQYQSPLARTSARKSLSMGDMQRPASLSAESIKAVAQLHQEVLVRETQDQQFVQSVPPHFPAFYPHAIIHRVYLVPHITMSQDDEDTLRIETRYGWENRCHEHLSQMEQNSTYVVAKEPIIVWLNAKENVFELRSRPWKLLGPGDELECFGLLVGNWWLTEKRERRTKWGTKKHHRHEEWVYALIENVETEEETYLRMPARHYDPPSLAMRITASWRKLSSLVTKRPL
ncbi:hypothetical protein B0H16DRAFT_1467178 [Mycena metata]|uniref:Uncharacterized protein n=1 Tax=Mycena metata TaxID=1033252 RepID=A0AAD7I699_9AGAR|nr:hypothetical protein B0H16DRAFT_1467178 [Mycena metata]